MKLTPENQIRELTDMKPFRASEDKKGHNIVVGAKIPTWLDRWITKLLELKNKPYELKSDVIRDALYIGLLVLGTRYEQEFWQLRASLANLKSRIDDKLSEYEEDDEFIERLRLLWYDPQQRKLATELAKDYITTLIDVKSDGRLKRLQEIPIVTEIMTWSEGSEPSRTRLPSEI